MKTTFDLRLGNDITPEEKIELLHLASNQIEYNTINENEIAHHVQIQYILLYLHGLFGKNSLAVPKNRSRLFLSKITMVYH